MSREPLQVIRHTCQISLGVVAFTCAWYYVMSFGRGGEPLNALLLSLFFLLIGFACSVGYISSWLSGNVSLFFDDSTMRLQRDYSEIRTMIQAGQYRSATERLEEEVADSGDPYGARLLSELLLDRLHQPHRAAEVAIPILTQRTWTDAHCELLNILVDYLLSIGDREDALVWLQRGVERAPDISAQQAAQTRLASLRRASM